MDWGMLDGGRYRAPAIVPRIVRWTLRLPFLKLKCRQLPSSAVMQLTALLFLVRHLLTPLFAQLPSCRQGRGRDPYFSLLSLTLTAP